MPNNLPLSQCRLLTRTEAAEYCRVGISTGDRYRKTVWKPFVVALGVTGGRIFFDRAKIDRWRDAGGMEE